MQQYWKENTGRRVSGGEDRAAGGHVSPSPESPAVCSAVCHCASPWQREHLSAIGKDITVPPGS